jgi:hypothetical protein
MESWLQVRAVQTCFVYLFHRWLLVLPTAMASDRVLFTSSCIFSHVIVASLVDKIVLCIQY